MSALPPEAIAIIGGYHADPFRYLGLHEEDGRQVVRTFCPAPKPSPSLMRIGTRTSWRLVHGDGLFCGEIPHDVHRYKLRVRWNGGFDELEDAYRFPPVLSDYDLYLLGEGTHLRAYEKVGAHPLVLDGVPGVAFVVLAPNAKRVSVVGDFNDWDGRRHAMRVRNNGYWEIFVPAATPDQKYKFEILGPDGALLPLKSDPFAFAAELRPATASIVVDQSTITPMVRAPENANRRDAPISIYEVHLGSWRRKPEENNRWLTYRELAEELPSYVAGLGFTHVEFLPIIGSNPRSCPTPHIARRGRCGCRAQASCHPQCSICRRRRQ